MIKVESTTVYELPWLLEKVYSTSDRIRDQLNNQTNFEKKCMRRLSQYLEGDPSRIYHKRYLSRMVDEVAASYLRSKYKKNFSIAMSCLVSIDENEEEVQYEPADVMVNVESEVIKTETIALLAKNDSRRTFILNCWSDGLTCDSTIARALARTFGTSMQTQRIAIQRFRIECRNTLTKAS